MNRIKTWYGKLSNNVNTWYDKLSNRKRDSIRLSIDFIGFIATIMTILGWSLNDCIDNMFISLCLVVVVFLLSWFIIYTKLGRKYKDSVSITVRETPVSIIYGNIFETEGWKVIGCDTHFDTRVDDIVISKKSLHGQLVIEHGDTNEIKEVVKEAAISKKLTANEDGLYDFDLGTIIRYDSSKEEQTYLMLAMTELNSNHEAHTNMAKFEQMLINMWREIDRVYASHDIVLPLLGTGISRFDDGPKDNESLLKCMLCTLNVSGVTLNSNITVVIYPYKKSNIQLYEYKSMFKSL